METFLLVMNIAGVAYVGITKAITAIQAGNDDEAITILETMVIDTSTHVSEMRAREQKNKDDHQAAIDKKFPPTTNEDTKQP